MPSSTTPDRAEAVYQYSDLTAARQVSLVSPAIRSGALATYDGALTPLAEHKVAGLVNRAAAIAVDSGSSALRLILHGLGIRPGDQVIVPEAGWVTVGGAAAILGADVVVAPVDTSLTPCWDQVEPLITDATKAVIICHLRGRPAPDIARISQHLTELGIHLVEDCAQGWGVDAAGRPAGSWGTATAFSTHSFKLVATGEGGFAAADDTELVSLMRALSGDTRHGTPTPAWRSKSRMGEAIAGLAVPQLDALPELVKSLRTLHKHAVAALDIDGITLVPDTNGIGNGAHVGMWTPAPGIARHLSASLHRAKFRSWWPGPGDLHTAAAWPVQAEHGEHNLTRYLDVQIPWLPDHQHAAFAEHLAATVRNALGERR
ncbi:aminotransferase class V-fold PLP-dependent enzyme [Embleya sp. NPDC059237]|uniref:aminotransferase class V-fold PLP-dependent enzyme n=1 Tax=Embleya sp. NPDC059237 TaxID=3346784 RepID=UPI0036BC5736